MWGSQLLLAFRTRTCSVFSSTVLLLVVQKAQCWASSTEETVLGFPFSYRISHVVLIPRFSCKVVVPKQSQRVSLSSANCPRGRYLTYKAGSRYATFLQAGTITPLVYCVYSAPISATAGNRTGSSSFGKSTISNPLSNNNHPDSPRDMSTKGSSDPLQTKSFERGEGNTTEALTVYSSAGPDWRWLGPVIGAIATIAGALIIALCAKMHQCCCWSN